MMKEVYLYRKLKDKNVQCRNCAHFCVIKDGERGTCAVRENRGGKLFALNYGKAAAIQIDPIEKKPFYHFLPKTFSLSVAAAGCNFACQNCQNWQISQVPKSKEPIEGKIMSPKAIVETALKNKLPSISYTYTEPAVFSEYALDTMKLAKKEGLKNAWVTNGFWSKELFEMIYPYLDAANVDLKGFDEDFYQKICQGKLQPVLDTLKRLKDKKIWLEITTLVLPDINDDETTFRNIARFIKKELGAETPWHITRFFADVSWRLKDVPDTPIETIEKALKIGQKTGLERVYSGNV